MNNLPWLKGRNYPLLLKQVVQLLDIIDVKTGGKPYIVENVMGARHGAKGLKKRGLESHGLKAGWLCGTMFGLPFYRHRLFASNWFWMAPGHPKHAMNLHPRSERYVYGGDIKGLLGGAAGLDVKPRFQHGHDGRGPESWPGRRSGPAGLTVKGINAWCANSNQAMGHNGPVTIGYDDKRNEVNGHSYPQHQGAGWRLAAEAMGITWMRREELTQAIPPAYSEFLGRQLMAYLATRKAGA